VKEIRKGFKQGAAKELSRGRFSKKSTKRRGDWQKDDAEKRKGFRRIIGGNTSGWDSTEKPQSIFDPG